MTCNCGGSKNQTHERVFKFVKESKLNIANDKDAHLGFGLFLIPAPELGVLEYKTVTVEGLSYRDTCKRGNNCEAYIWIPKGYVGLIGNNEELIVDSLEALERLRDDCSDACGHCPMNGCFCYRGESMCHRR